MHYVCSAHPTPTDTQHNNTQYLFFDLYIVLSFQNEGHCLHDLFAMSTYDLIYMLSKVINMTLEDHLFQKVKILKDKNHWTISLA